MQGGVALTKLLLCLFVRNYQNPDRPAVHSAVGTLAGFTGIFCNVLLFLVKLFVGILSGAVSIVADALNNLLDATSSVVTLIGFWLAKRPADPDHPYGHARYEYISGLVVAALILVVGVELAESSVLKILSPAPVTVSAITLIILIASSLTKLWMCRFYLTLGRMIHSGTLKATAIDSRNDMIATMAVLLGCMIERIFAVPADGYIGLAVALFVIWSGIGVARETISPLLGQRADQSLVEQINGLLLGDEKVLGVHDLLVHDYGPGQCFASVHVEISAEENPLICHEIIDRLECCAKEQLNVHLVIHYDPVEENDSERDEMLRIVQEILFDLGPCLSVHDFRIVRGSKKPKLVFDLAVPYEKRQEHQAIKSVIEQELKRRGKTYLTVIHFDDIA